jgi:transposase
MRILRESSSESEWVATCLEDLGHEVIVADPNFAARYGTRTRRIKTDRRDVAALAETNRTGVYRPAYRVSSGQRAIRQRLLVRDQLVRMRTQLIADSPHERPVPSRLNTPYRPRAIRLPRDQIKAAIASVRQDQLLHVATVFLGNPNVVAARRMDGRRSPGCSTPEAIWTEIRSTRP